MGEEHLDLLTFEAGLPIRRRSSDASGHVPRLLVDAAVNFAECRVGTAAGLQRAGGAVRRTTTVDDGVSLVDVRAVQLSPIAAQGLPGRAAIFVGCFFPLKILAGEAAVLTPGPVPDRHVWFDVFLLDHPSQHWCRTVGRIADEALWFEVKSLFDPVHHDLRRFDFHRPVGGRCFDIDDHAMGRVDEVVSRIGKEGRLTGGPPSALIAGRSGKGCGWRADRPSHPPARPDIPLLPGWPEAG